MTDYEKLAEMISSSRNNLKNTLRGRVSTSELLQKSILEEQLAKEKAKKDLEERRKLKEKEEKDLLFENVNRIVPQQPQGAPVAVVPRRRRGRPKGVKNKNNNLDLATEEELIEILEEEKKKDAEEEKKLKQTDIRRFMRRKQEERNWEKILEEEERKEEAEEEERKEAAPKKRGRKRGSKNKPKNKSLTSRLIREARQSVITGEGMKKNKKDKKDKKKKEKSGTYPLKIDKKRQDLIVELNLLMGSIKSGSSNKKMNNRAKNILKQLNK